MESPEGGLFADELLFYCGLRELPHEVVYRNKRLSRGAAREFDWTIIRAARKYRSEMLKRAVASLGKDATADVVAAMALQRLYVDGR